MNVMEMDACGVADFFATKGIASKRTEKRVIAKFTGRDWYVLVGGKPLRDKGGEVRRFESMSEASRAGHVERRR